MERLFRWVPCAANLPILLLGENIYDCTFIHSSLVWLTRRARRVHPLGTLWYKSSGGTNFPPRMRIHLYPHQESIMWVQIVLSFSWVAGNTVPPEWEYICSELGHMVSEWGLMFSEWEYFGHLKIPPLHKYAMRIWQKKVVQKQTEPEPHLLNHTV